MILSSADPRALAQAVQTIADGGLVGMPTETVYGLGADASNDAAVAAIFAAKGRTADHPLIVHVADMDAGLSGVHHYAQQVPDFAQALMTAFWPGALTLILPRRPEVAAAAAGGQDSIGLRCPSHPAAQALLHALRKRPAKPVWGIAAPSANRFGRVSPTTAAHVQSELGDALLVLDGGPCSLGIESTIVDCTRGVPVLLRPGAIDINAWSQACGQPVRLAYAQAQAPRASGTLESHYAPRAKVRLMPAKALHDALQAWYAAPVRSPALLGVYAHSVVPPAKAGMHFQVMPGTAAHTAHELFAVLRALDDAGVQEIWVEAVPAGTEWAGVADRLQRASA
ncbi:MAG: L-threonylcarbamoyladenylate synthase [Rhodoferax sp.]